MSLLEVIAMLVGPSILMILFAMWVDSIEVEPVYFEEEPQGYFIIFIPTTQME